MASAVETKKVIKGGSFILEDHDASDVFTPDDLSDEHLMIAQTAREFTEKEIIPLDAEIESKDYELTRALLRKAGELGLLSIDIPEKYGGAGLDLLSSLVASGQCRARLRSRDAPDSQPWHAAPLYFGTGIRRSSTCQGSQQPRCLAPIVNRIGLRIGRARRQDQSRALRRRKALRPQRTEDVDHQRRLRGRVHRVRKGRWRDVYGVYRRTYLSGRFSSSRRA